MNKSLALLIPGVALIAISMMLLTSGGALALSGEFGLPNIKAPLYAVAVGGLSAVAAVVGIAVSLLPPARSIGVPHQPPGTEFNSMTWGKPK
jgi:hypothetical protein